MPGLAAAQRLRVVVAAGGVYVRAARVLSQHVHGGEPAALPAAAAEQHGLEEADTPH